MKEHELIGLVATEYLRQSVHSKDADDGVARFLLDRLTGDQVAEICKHILKDDELKEKVEIKIPVQLVQGHELPIEILTDRKTTHWRNAPCEKQAILLANTNDDQDQSLRDITSIGSRELKANVELWVKVVSKGLSLSDEHRGYWEKALTGLQEVQDFSLDQFSRYVVNVRDKMIGSDISVIEALGWALPFLRIPRDSGYFRSIPDKGLSHKSKWKKLYADAISKRACFLTKQTPTRVIIENDQLEKGFEEVKEDIDPSLYPIIQRFLEAKPVWCEESERLAELEWESDNIGSIFSGIKVKKGTLAKDTLDFFEDNFPESLSEDERAQLESMSKRKKKEATEEDQEFYDRHRNELESSPSLKSKWDRFVYGKPIECTDFLIGLLQSLERLYEQSRDQSGKKKLKIRTHIQNSKANWLKLNADVAIYFATRYRGLPDLMGPNVEWETHHLFKFDELIEQQKKKQNNKYKENVSFAKAAIQIKFYVELHSQGTPEFDRVQLIWSWVPNLVGLELHNDLKRIANREVLLSSVARNPINKKGRLQGVSLSDIGTLQAVYRQDRGSFIGAYDKSKDIAKIFRQNLEAAYQEKRVSTSGYECIREAWDEFSTKYLQSIREFLTNGVASEALLDQAELYRKTISTLQENAPGDLNRIELWEPVLNVGNTKVQGGMPTAIITPWHPMRLLSIAVKARQVAGFIKHLLRSESVDFGDTKLFFSDLINEQTHPYYPEVTIGYNGKEARLLAHSDTVNDYSLMEEPTRREKNQETNEDPKEASEKINNLLKRYVELQPHEKSNLSIMLYNCDSTRLPEEVIKSLTDLYEEDEEVRCQVSLWHNDFSKLADLYKKLVDGNDADSDVHVASEVSHDFMARRRIGVMTEIPHDEDPKAGKPADIVFLQDVISREAEIEWVSSSSQFAPDVKQHVPPRWSKRRPTSKDDLKTVTYLVCPVQPDIGAVYLEAVSSIVNKNDASSELGFQLPARRVTFQNDNIHKIFEEVHKLGEWVVNYDDLLERRQLQNQGVKVIKYKHTSTQGKTLIVSSKSNLNMLHIQVKRRLESLNLSLEEHQLKKLAERFIDDANSLSGDIVLRAAKRGIFASELLGVVLSKALLEEEIGQQTPTGWFFLDDYANWLGQKEEQIADILAIGLKIENDEPRLQVIVSESKFVDIKALADSRNNSQKQLRDTVDRIERAIFGSPGRLDRDLWLARLSDLLIDGVDYNQHTSFSIEEWREKVRRGIIPIDLKGYSHVFVTGTNESNVQSDQVAILNVENRQCYQEIYNREMVRELILAYYNDRPLTLLREKIGDDRPWEMDKARLPAERVVMVSDLSSTDYVDDSSTEQVFDDNPDKGRDSVVSEEQEISLNEEDGDLEVTVVHDLSLNDLLHEGDGDETNAAEAEEWLTQTVNKLKSALISYDLHGKVLGQRLTPNAAIIRLKGSDRLRIKDIEKNRLELLTTHGLEILSIMAQPGEILVSIARPERETVSLKAVWKRRKVNRSASGFNMSFVLGVKEVDGELLYLNLGKAFEGLEQHSPHTLIAGATGSGKSVLLQNLVLDICATNTQDLAHIYLIDPKFGVDYQHLEELPHLQGGIIIEQEKAVETLEYLVAEMDRRYLKFRDVRVNSLSDYNSKVQENEQLPLLFLVHDEFAEWMLIDSYRDAVSATVQRLGVKARAAGIHLIFAAQRPDANVLPVQLRDNLGNRLILRVESVGTSEIALGEKGAEKLLGKGHLAARLAGENGLIYAQVPFLSSEDMYAITEEIRKGFSF